MPNRTEDGNLALSLWDQETHLWAARWIREFVPGNFQIGSLCMMENSGFVTPWLANIPYEIEGSSVATNTRCES